MSCTKKIDTIYRSVKEWICDKYVETIKSFIGQNETSPSTSVDRSHDWMGQIINFTNQQFVLFSNLSPTTVPLLDSLNSQPPTKSPIA